MANDVEITVRVANQTASGVTGVNQSMQRLRSSARDAGGALDLLSARSMAAATALRVLDGAADGAGDSLRQLRARAAAAAASLDEMHNRTSANNNSLRTMNTRMATADGRLGDLSTRTRTLRSDTDDLDGSMRRLTGTMGGLRGSLGTIRTASGNAANSQRRLLMAAVALAPALIPVGAAATLVGGQVVAGLGAATVAVGAFGAALIPQILAMGKIGEAQKAYTKAVDEHGKRSEEATKAEAAWLREIGKADPAVRKAAAALSVMKDQYKEWSKSLQGDTLPVATKSFAVLGALFPKLSPVVKGASVELGRFMSILAGGVQSAGFDAFMVKFTEFSNRTLYKAVSGIVNLSKNIAGLGSNSEFQRFMDYAKENAPLVGETLKNLARAVANLVEGLSGAGVSILTVVNAFARLVAAIPPSFLSVLIQTYAAMKLFAMGAAAVAAVTGGAAVARLAAYFAVMRAAGVATTLRATAASMTAVQKAGLGLGILAVAAIGISKLAEKARGAPPDVDRLTTSLKNLADTGKFSGELKKSFGDIDGVVKKIGELGDATKKQEEYLDSFGAKGVPVLEDLRRGAHNLWQDFTEGEKSLSALGDDFKSLDEAMASMVGSGYGKQAGQDFDLIRNAALKAGYSTKDLAELFPKYQDAVAAMKAEQALAAAGMGLFGDQAMAVQAKLNAQKQSTDGLRQSIIALNEVNRAALDGRAGMEAAMDAAASGAKKLGDALHYSNGELDLNSAEAREANGLLNALARTTEENVTSARDSGRSWEYAKGQYDRGKAALIKAADAMGLNTSEAKRLAEQILQTPNKTAYLKGNMQDLQQKLTHAKNQLARVPDSRKASVRARIDQLNAAIAEARRKLNAIDGTTATTYVKVVTSKYPNLYGPGIGSALASGGITGAAGGGPRSRQTLVGEQGPELVDLAPGSTVRSNPDTRRMMASSGGDGGQPIVIQLHIDGKELGEIQIDPLRHAISRRGGLTATFGKL